jgi:methionyl-tRNA synthetase
MSKRYCNGVVPEPGELTATDQALLDAIDEAFDTVGSLYDACKFRQVTQEILHLSTLVNQYLEEMQPWSTAKSDMATTGRTLYVALQAISGLKILWSPILPFTGQQLHEMLGEEGHLFGEQLVETYTESEKSHQGLTYNGRSAGGTWQRSPIPAGRSLPQPQPLFKKLDDSVAQEELARLVNP